MCSVEAAGATPATVKRSQQIDFVSGINGRTYRVRMSWPRKSSRQEALPVVYVLDGDSYFGTITEATRSRASYDLAAALIVGIGYPDDDPVSVTERRAFDLTPTPPSPEPSFLPESYTCGGLDSFLDVLEREVRPMVAQRQAVDETRSVIFGHSLGGLAVLHALFTRPAVYAAFLAIDPSIWWNDRALLRAEAAFARAVEAKTCAPRVYVSCARVVNKPRAEILAELGATAQQFCERVARSRMAENAGELASRLQALEGAPAFAVRFDDFAGDTHGSVPFSSLLNALAFALPMREEKVVAHRSDS
jgi:predicted alpha/beta superfamily hydrolase